MTNTDGTYTAYSEAEANKLIRILDGSDASYTMQRKVSHDQRDGKLVQTVFTFNTNQLLRALIKKM